MIVDKAVSHASAAFVVCLQNSFVHKALDFAEGGVVACVEEDGGFFCGEWLREATCHDFVDEQLFAGAERVVCVGAAELDAADFRSEKFFAIFDGVSQHLQEPQNPFGEVAAGGLRACENFEVVAFMDVNLFVQRVLAMRRVFGAGELHGCDGAGESAVCVGEGANRDEPEMCNCGFNHPVYICAFKPR